VVAAAGPIAKSLDEEERTSIDPPAVGTPWEDGSTSVDEATASDPGPRGPGTGTGDVPTSNGDEPTTEDPRRASQPLVLLPPSVKPRPAAARLVAVSGNDTGRHFALDPARLMSIGRAVDNEIVLTDIAVSRRHLELSFDGTNWILRDRGSGNGTLVNDKIEDGVYPMRHGDRIELGNTVLRFELPTPPATAGWGQRDDDEASTIAGRQPPRPVGLPGVDPAVTSPMPKVRPSAARIAPAASKPADASTARPGQLGAGTSAPPVVRADGLERGDPSGSGRRGPLPAPPPAVEDSAPVLKVTAGSIAATADQGSSPGRHFTTTALVEPFPRSPTAVPYPFPMRPISGRKLAMVGGIGALVVALIGVVAALTTDDDSLLDSVATAAPLPASTWGTDETAMAAGLGAFKAAEGGPKGTRLALPDGADEHDALSGADPAAEPVMVPRAAAPPTATTAVAESPPVAAKVAEAPPVNEPAGVKEPAPTKEPPPAKAPIDEPIEMPPVETAKAPEVRPGKPAKEPAAAKTAAVPARPTVAPKVRKVVAAAQPERAPKSAVAARKKAATQYAAKDFRGAAATLRAAAPDADDGESDELIALATDYDAVGSSLNAGNTALTSNPPDATAAFQRALTTDRRLGGVHAEYLRAKLAQSSPKAAASFMARGNLEAAKRAVDTAVSVGAGASPTVQQVRQSLDRKAGELYASGMKALNTDREDALALLRRVLKIVDTSSPWYAKAYRVVNAKK
jgi:hypothetical protein